MISLLNSDLSLLIRSHFGTGKSLATALFLLSHSLPVPLQRDFPTITNLLVVPTPALAIQHYQTIKKLIENSPLKLHDIAQCIFRADEKSEQMQIDLLKSNPGPHILIGTPTRILDILSSKNRADLPLFNLSCIALDEVDNLLPARNVYTALKRTHSFSHDHRNNIPTQVLLNHIVPWRNAYVKQHSDMYIPLRFIMESSTASKYIKVLSMQNKWISDRPMLRLGSDHQEEKPKNRLPNDVDSYFVSYNTLTGELTDTDYDVSSLIPQFDEENLEILSELNERRLKEQVKSYSSLTAKEKLTIMKIYASALARVLEMESKSDKSNNHPRALVVIPEAFSISAFSEVLKETEGIIGAIETTCENSYGYSYKMPDDPTPIMIDTNTFFVEQKIPNNENINNKLFPQVLITRAKKCLGLDFPGLNRIYAMSWDSILSSNIYLTLAGRCRVAPAAERNETGITGPWRPHKSLEQGKIVVVSTSNETSDMRYKILLAGIVARVEATPQKFF